MDHEFHDFYNINNKVVLQPLFQDNLDKPMSDLSKKSSQSVWLQFINLHL